MKALGVAKAAELREALARVADADAVVAEWRRRVAEWEASPEARGRGRASGREVEAELRRRGGDGSPTRSGGFVRDVRSIEAEIQRLEAEAARRGPRRAGRRARARRPPRPAGDPLRALARARGRGARRRARPRAARAVAAKASQALAGLSFQRLQALQVDERGNARRSQAGGRAVPAATLPLADRDLVYLALKLALLEQALAAGKAVAIADDAFAGLSDGARRFAARLLKQIARPGQLLHATADPAFREAADHAA